jgi:hypothetical protein
MMGLSDRIEPWARRFQRPRAGPAPRERRASAGGERPVPATRRSGRRRFLRRALQER